MKAKTGARKNFDWGNVHGLTFFLGIKGVYDN